MTEFHISVALIGIGTCLMLLAIYWLASEMMRGARRIDYTPPPPGWPDREWPYNTICVRQGHCIIDHSPCNRVPRIVCRHGYNGDCPGFPCFECIDAVKFGGDIAA